MNIYVRVLILSMVLLIVSCSDSRVLHLTESKQTDAELEFKGTLLQYNDAEAAETMRFYEKIVSIADVYKDISPTNIKKVKVLIDDISTSAEQSDLLLKSIEDYVVASESIENKWLEYVSNEQRKYQQEVNKAQTARDNLQKVLDDYYEIVKQEKMTFDEVTEEIDETKRSLDASSKEVMEFVNAKIVEEQIAVAKINQGNAANALKKATYAEPGSQTYRLAKERTELYCPNDPNKTKVSVRRRDSFVYCEAGSLIELDNVEAFFSLNVFGGMSMDDYRFPERNSENWTHLAAITKDYKANAKRLTPKSRWVEGGDLFLKEAAAKKAYQDKAQIAVNTLGMQSTRTNILDRGYYEYRIEKHNTTISNFQSRLDKVASASAKTIFYNKQLKTELARVKKDATKLTDDSFKARIANINDGTKFTIGDSKNLKEDTMFIVLVGDIYIPGDGNKRSVPVGISKFVPQIEGDKHKTVSIEFDQFQRTSLKESWLALLIHEIARHQGKQSL